MKCPKCKNLIEYGDIETVRPEDQREPYFDINISCSNCEAEFFARIHERDLIPCI